MEQNWGTDLTHLGKATLAVLSITFTSLLLWEIITKIISPSTFFGEIIVFLMIATPIVSVWCASLKLGGLLREANKLKREQIAEQKQTNAHLSKVIRHLGDISFNSDKSQGQLEDILRQLDGSAAADEEDKDFEAKHQP